MTDSPKPLFSPEDRQPKSWWAGVGAVIRDAFALFGAFMMLAAFGVTFESAAEKAVLVAVMVVVVSVAGIARYRRRRAH